MTQKELILKYIDINGKITPKEAEDFIGCMRLASRICDLKKDGHKIVSKKVKVKTRSGYAWVSQYSKQKPEAQNGNETNVV